MKKEFINSKPEVKVETLRGYSNVLDKGIVVFVALLLSTNFLISMKIIFG